MKVLLLILLAPLATAGRGGAEQPPVFVAPTPTARAAEPAPPPSAPAKLAASELEKLVAPIALYPDPLLAVLLPATAYPLEIVQAARFVEDTNNLVRLDQQPWDANVKAVARFPTVIRQLNRPAQSRASAGDAFNGINNGARAQNYGNRGAASRGGGVRTEGRR